MEELNNNNNNNNNNTNDNNNLNDFDDDDHHDADNSTHHDVEIDAASLSSSLMIDPPPVIFECDSFVLTSTGTSSELIFLDPFDGRLSIIQDITTHCVASDEAMMEQAMFMAADAISTVPRNSLYDNWNDNEIAGHCFDESVMMNQTRHELPPPPPSQELLSDDDYFTFDIRPYFQHRRLIEEEENNQHRDILSDEYDMSFVGVESKPIVDPKENIMKGIMVGIGRTVTNLQEEDIVCTELSFWTKTFNNDVVEEDSSANQYKNKQICRFPWSFGTVDFDPLHERIFVSFLQNDGDLINPKNVHVYPMITFEGEDDDDRQQQKLFSRTPIYNPL